MLQEEQGFLARLALLGTLVILGILWTYQEARA